MKEVVEFLFCFLQENKKINSPSPKDKKPKIKKDTLVFLNFAEALNSTVLIPTANSELDHYERFKNHTNAT